ncbi:hypothetical protein, partial [Alistipes finegoldii]|uniref:hypothetical protein n=1 Tax=Alistipes finegoldii TaxID=214856 RepID=UPI00307D4060
LSFALHFFIPLFFIPGNSLEYQGFSISRGDWIRTSDHTPPRQAFAIATTDSTYIDGFVSTKK